MMQNPTLVHALARDRAAELRQAGAGCARSRRENGRRHVTQAIRRGTGWLLVDLGLRLAVPGGAAHRPARGQR